MDRKIKMDRYKDKWIERKYVYIERYINKKIDKQNDI